MPRALRVLTAAVGLLVLAPALVGCGDDVADIKVGDLVHARTDAQFVDGVDSVVALPIGRLEVYRGEPTTKLGADDTRQREAVDAPEGATFIPITWQYDAATYGNLADYVGREESPTVELVADKARYRLPPPEPTGEGSESFYIPVNGSGEDAALSIDYDGVTQTVDLATGERDEGAAAPLYDLGAKKPKSRNCTDGADFHKNAGKSDYQCKVTRPVRIPYANGEWARKGHTFVAVTVNTTVRRLDILGTDFRSGAIYTATGVTSNFRFGGAKPVLAAQGSRNLCPDRTKGGCTGRYHVVFDVTDKKPRRLQIKQSFQLQIASQWGDFDRNKRMKLKVSTGLQLG